MNLDKIRKYYELKSVERMNSQGNRKENSAEHTWSTLILADLFIEYVEQPIDKLKVFEILLYHDVVEIEAGDTPNTPFHKRDEKEEKEYFAAKLLQTQLEKGEKFYNLFMEYENQETIESKFAKCMDNIDAMIHEMDYKKDWKGWSDEFLRSRKEKYFEEFPKLKEFFEELLTYLVDNEYITKT